MSMVLVESPELFGIESAEDWRDNYYRNYHPDGYGTRLFVKPARPGYFIVVGNRWDSCD